MTNKTTRGSTFKNHQITDKVIQMIQDESLLMKFARPWIPTNLRQRNFNGSCYGPMNNFLLSAIALEREFKSPFWITESKGRKSGGTLIAGEKCTEIYTYVRQYITEEGGKVKWHDKKPKNKNTKVRFVLRTIDMYNVNQFNWLKLPEEFFIESFSNPSISEDEMVEQVENYVNPYLNKHKIKVKHLDLDRAFYSITFDEITLPPKNSFKSSRGYAGVFVHEVIHSTGHKSRLDRLRQGKEGEYNHEEEYSLEELVAELGSAIILHDLGVPCSQEELERSVDYMKGWSRKLSAEPKWFAWADSRSKRAKNLIEKHQEKDAIDKILKRIGKKDKK